jgi:hypothetical protein
MPAGLSNRHRFPAVCSVSIQQTFKPSSTGTPALPLLIHTLFKNEICEKNCALRTAVAQKKEIHNREYQITNIDGRQIPIICSTSAFWDESGNVTGGLAEIDKKIISEPGK